MSDADLVVRLSRKKIVPRALYFFVLSAALVAMVFVFPIGIVGEVLVAGMCALSLYHGWAALRLAGQWLFVITSSGIQTRKYGFLDWSDISSVRLVRISRNVFLGIDLIPSSLAAQRQESKAETAFRAGGAPHLRWPVKMLDPPLATVAKELDTRTGGLLRL